MPTLKPTLKLSPEAQRAYHLVTKLQQHFVQRLEALSLSYGKGQSFTQKTWLRNAGHNGGGLRYVAPNDDLFNRGSINVSQVHYLDDATKPLSSTSALSAIVHPDHPCVPSIHLHISWTEMKSGQGYWRLMADLNPAMVDENAKQQFNQALQAAAPEYFAKAQEQGEQYFYIPALKRHRGIAHFYLEHFNTGHPEADLELAQKLGLAAINTYMEICTELLSQAPSPSPKDKQQQLHYHTLYLFQVLSLDRGTSAGLLVHQQNDLGILASLPRWINAKLLASWVELAPELQQPLLKNIVSVLGTEEKVEVDEAKKQQLAQVLRQHYQQYPAALDLQARGAVQPNSRANHQGM